ncbi:MAG: glutathione S-transferase C-terminal domain-containing protein [Halioglobus sp.]
MDYVSVAEAIEAPGLRLVLSAGVPGPWGESVKALLAYKNMDYLAVYQRGGGENAELLAWTGQTSAPVLISDKLPAACHWLDLLMLVERLNPEPALLPEDPALRASAIGFCALIAGADGFGWYRRLIMLEPMMKLDPVPDMTVRLAHKYGYSQQALASAAGKMREICTVLDAHLTAQRGDYFFGDSPSAVDFYWANFAGMIKPLPAALNPMPEWFRPVYTTKDPELLACLTPHLEAHRDMMYQRHIATPLDF